MLILHSPEKKLKILLLKEFAIILLHPSGPNPIAANIVSTVQTAPDVSPIGIGVIKYLERLKCDLLCTYVLNRFYFRMLIIIKTITNEN